MDNFDIVQPLDNNAEEELVLQSDPLALEIEDSVLLSTLTRKIDDAKSDFKKKKIYSRQQINLDYLLGRQIDEAQYKEYSSRFVDNLIYEAEATIKPIALSRLPDLIVDPGNEGEMSSHNAEILTKKINADMSKRDMRKVLSVAFKHIPVYFIAAIKYRWDPEKGKNGDFVFEVVHPDNLVFDNTATSNNIDEHDFIAQTVELSVKEIIMRFPDKKKEILEEFNIDETSDKYQTLLASKYKIWEVWFKWYKETPDGYTVENGVMWKYGNTIFRKMKNPNWDWEGTPTTFTYDSITNEKRPANEAEIKLRAQFQAMGIPLPPELDQMENEQVFRNYFDFPRFPYILIGYDQMGKMVYDETSRIEQVLRLQENVNKRGRQVTEMLDKANGIHVFTESAGMSKEDVEKLDTDNPSINLLVKGKAGEAHSYIEKQQPSAQAFNDLSLSRDKVFEKMGTNSTTRGQVETDTATTAQISRESDYGRIDDLVEDTINYAAEQIAVAILQMIKLRYNEDHFIRDKGQEGQQVFYAIKNDLVEDGMEVTVHASAVDKVLRKKQAYELLQASMIDPYQLFIDLELSNPKERTERLITFMMGQSDGYATYMTKYVLGLENTEQQAAALNGVADASGLPPEPPVEQMPPEQMGAPIPEQVPMEVAPEAQVQL